MRHDTDSFAVVARRDPNVDPYGHSEGDATWIRQVARTIANEMKWWRKQRALSNQQLSERCSRLGYPISRDVLANLETRSQAFTLPQLLAIAMALNVPPILLVYPLGARHVMAAPDYRLSPWEAIKWFVGDDRPKRRMLGTDEEATDGAQDNGSDRYDTGGLSRRSRVDRVREWEQAFGVLELYRRHDQYVRRYQFEQDGVVQELRRMAEPGIVERGEERRRTDALARDLTNTMEILKRHRRYMRGLGLEPPALPPNIDLGADE